MAAGKKRGRPSARAEGTLLLDDQLCFALYAASRAVTQRYRPLLDEVGITYPQYLVMLVLWEQGTTTVKGLGDALQLDYGTLSPLLKRLAAAGYVARNRRTDDERSVEIALTDAGRALEARVGDIPQLIVDAYGLDAEGFAGLRATLRELAESVAAAERA
jgi:MarR family transcriptional regulator, organic hydroperoxide resistance regulator